MCLLLALGLAACSAQRFEYEDQTEIPEGKGMLSGEDGAVTVSIGDEEGPPRQQDGGATAAPVADAAGSDEGNAAPSGCTCDQAAELEAYREFLRWKAEAVGTPEYREFQDWRAWRRENRDDE